MPVPTPFNLSRWIEENRDQLKPPIGAKRVFDYGDTIAIIVGGPNTRRDYHVDPAEELFYQIEGDMVLKIVDDDGTFRDIDIREGDVFLLPAGVPHSPQRFANTVGLVVERKRTEAEDDRVCWFCESCGNKLFEASFNINNGGFLPQLTSAVDAYHADRDLRTCNVCGTVQPAPGDEDAAT